ncbi:hypothetical protein D3C77_470410 [compost metagenome]
MFVNEPPRIKDYFACKLCQSVFDLKCFNQTTYVVIVYMRKYDKIYLFALSFKLIKKGSEFSLWRGSEGSLRPPIDQNPLRDRS